MKIFVLECLPNFVRHYGWSGVNDKGESYFTTHRYWRNRCYFGEYDDKTKRQLDQNGQAGWSFPMELLTKLSVFKKMVVQVVDRSEEYVTPLETFLEHCVLLEKDSSHPDRLVYGLKHQLWSRYVLQ